MIELVLILTITLYAFVLVVVGIKFSKNIDIYAKRRPALITFSVVIPFRNEATMLPDLLESLAKLNYPNTHLEIIFINDHSEDNGLELLTSMATIVDFKMTILNNSANLYGKKNALSTGIKAAQYNYIITLDADCMVPVDLINLYNQNIVDTGNLMVVGPVKYAGNKSGEFWQEYQIFENAGLVAIGSIAAQMGISFLSNGANLCFQKDTFFEVGGYAGNEHIASGDDEFLLEKFNKRCPKNIGFLHSYKAIVTTPVQPNLQTLINQRTRWAGKSRYKKNKSVFLLQIFTVLLYLSLFLFILYSLFISGEIQVAVFVLSIKIIGDVLFYFKIRKFFGLHLSWINVFLTSIGQLIVIPVIGFIAISGKFTWKDRKF